MKIMASGPITSCQIHGETVETVSDFIFWGSKITADGDCSHEIKKTLAPWKESYDQSRQHLKRQQILLYFGNKDLSSQSYVFSAVTTEQLHFHFSLSCTGEGNGNLLQYSCLETPRDGRAWWAAICGVVQSPT